MTKTKFTTLIVSLLVALSFQSALAISTGNISGQPAGNPYSSLARNWFVYTLDPGTEVKDAVEVYNPTAKEKTILLYAADTTPSSEGGFALKQRVEPMSKVGTWITMSKNEIVLAPGQSESVEFTINVPAEGLDVGEHSGGIMIEEKPVENGTTGVKLSTRVGLRVYITIPGDVIKKIDYSFFNSEITANREYRLPFGLGGDKPFMKVPGAYDFKLGVVNKGNVSTDIDYVFKVEDVLFGKYNIEQNKTQKTERDTATTSHFEWVPPLFGKYRISVDTSYKGKDAQMVDEEIRTLTSDVIEMWIIPWDLIIGIVLLLLTFGLLYLARKRWKNRKMVKKPAKKSPSKAVKKPVKRTAKKPAKSSAPKAVKKPVRKPAKQPAKSSAPKVVKKPAKKSTKSTKPKKRL